MVYKINQHVERLHRYLPFDPSHDQIYEENRQPGDSLEIETKALKYLEGIVRVGDTRVVILTGDAGHGKTHLCSRLIRDYLGYSPEVTRDTVRERCDGRVLAPAESSENNRSVRIYKDFSEPTLEAARHLLTNALSDPESVSVVCVNEGRLRSILAGADQPELESLNHAFNASFDSGLASPDGKLHIVNLNYQSVATTENSILERVLTGEGRNLGWLAPRRWSACESCDAVAGCPIRRNVALLEGQTGGVRRSRLRELMAITERLGTVITIREILMTVAYFLTGGLRCKDVHRLYEKNGRSEGWQPAYIFYNLLFSPPMTLSADKLARIPLLKELGKLDPGLVADRRVDEALINDPDIFSDASFELIFAGRLGRREAQVDARFGIDEIVADARSRDERDAEEEFTKRVIRSLRRRDFFDGHPEGDLAASRLGFNHYDDFRWILSGENDNSRKVMIKNHLIAGLHTIQGLRLARGESALLHLVDPAFGRSTNHAAIIAKKIASKHLKLIPQSERWGDLGEVRAFPLSQAVDWIDREVVLLYVDADGEKTLYPMDLLTFDCIMRAASGYVPANFYAHDIRRIMNFLSLLAERSGEIEPDKIDVMVAGHMHSVVLEEGDVISVGGELI